MTEQREPAAEPTDIRLGVIYAVAAHTLWGLFPLFWRLLADVPAVELVCHRIVWSWVVIVVALPILVRLLPDGRMLLKPLRSGRIWLVYAAAAVMIATNWLAFIWACNNDRVLEASLGYYINPLISVMLGVLVLGERLSRKRWIAIGWAGVGVAVMAISGGGLPWVSLAMAFSFAFYGLAKKKAPIPGVTGLLIETSLLSVPAGLLLVSLQSSGRASFLTGTVERDLLLAGGGVVTVTPLLLFAAACRHAPLSIIGILQYVGPTLQFIVGTVVLSEPLGMWRLVGFAFVWTGSVIFLSDRTRSRPVAEETTEAATQAVARQAP